MLEPVAHTHITLDGTTPQCLYLQQDTSRSNGLPLPRNAGRCQATSEYETLGKSISTSAATLK
jgi:hypothetical protein